MHELTDGLPRAFAHGKKRRVVARIRDIWEVQEGWWRETTQQIDRMYVAVTLVDGRPATLYHDRVSKSWYLQAY